MMKKELIRKGHKKVYTYMKNRGYNLYDCIETENGYEAEWYCSFAGVTQKTVIVIFNEKWRVIDVR